MVKMCLANAVCSRWKSAACVFALWVFANRIEFPGGWRLAVFAGGAGQALEGYFQGAFRAFSLFIFGNMAA